MNRLPQKHSKIYFTKKQTNKRTREWFHVVLFWKWNLICCVGRDDIWSLTLFFCSLVVAIRTDSVEFWCVVFDLYEVDLAKCGLEAGRMYTRKRWRCGWLPMMILGFQAPCKWRKNEEVYYIAIQIFLPSFFLERITSSYLLPLIHFIWNPSWSSFFILSKKGGHGWHHFYANNSQSQKKKN